MRTKFTLLFLSIFFLAACGTKSTVLLLNSGKAQNAVVVSNEKGSQTLDKVGSFVTFKDKETAPSSPKEMDKEEISKRFASVLSATPLKAVSFRLYFQPSKMLLTEESSSTLKEAILAIKKHTPCVVDIIGHTDTVGTNALNLAVSLKRAKYVESLILEKNLKDISLFSKGHGEEDLSVKTPDNTDEALNRNVEIFIK
jgi:outer membrane protein OmpA-like peptidoglycan-associated protein